MSPLEIERPWRVMTVTGMFHSGHMTREGAESRMEYANKAAKELQLETRYVVEEKA